MGQPDERDLELIWRHVSGAAEAGDAEALERLLAEHPERAEDLFALAEERLALEAVLREPEPARMPRRRFQSRSSPRMWPIPAGLAAAVLVAVILGWFMAPGSGRVTGSRAAQGPETIGTQEAPSPGDRDDAPRGTVREVTIAASLDRAAPREPDAWPALPSDAVPPGTMDRPVRAAGGPVAGISTRPSTDPVTEPPSDPSSAPGETRAPDTVAIPAPDREGTMPVVAVVASCRGDVFVLSGGTRTRVRTGDRLLAGQGVETAASPARADLAFQDEMRLVLGAETSIRDLSRAGPGRARTLAVSRGMLHADVTPHDPDQPLVLVAPQGEARILGTSLRLVVDADPDGVMQIEVLSGKVRLSRKRDGRTLDVSAGHFAEIQSRADLLRSRRVATVAFQDGVAPAVRYEGTRDTTVAEYRDGARRNFGAGASVWADGDTADMNQPGLDKSALIRWDLSSIPRNVQVIWAEIDVVVVNDSGGRPFGMYALRRAWEESQATWMGPLTGTDWQKPGAQGELDRGESLLGALAPAASGPHGAFLTREGLSVVQAWIVNPAVNHGLILADTENGDALGFKSREATPPNERPRLTISFVAR